MVGALGRDAARAGRRGGVGGFGAGVRFWTSFVPSVIRNVIGSVEPLGKPAALRAANMSVK